MRESLVHTVGDGSIVKQGCKHQLDCLQNLVDSLDIEEGFLLSREGGIG